MIWSASEEVLPISRLPESESLHVIIIITHGGVTIWRALQIEVDKFLEVGPHNLIGVDEDHFLQIHWEEYIQEQNFVSPNDTLLLGLRTQPRWPLVCDELILEAVRFSKVRYKFLHTKINQTKYQGAFQHRQRTRNEGDKKFSMNQNLTVCFVFRRTLSIMMPTKRCGSELSEESLDRVTRGAPRTTVPKQQ